MIPDALSRAFPITAISLSNSISSTDDTWYKTVYNGCLNTPSKYSNFLIKNNSLFRLSKTNSPLTLEFAWKEVAPKEFRESIIANYHSEPTAGHLGIFKTYRRLSLTYYWPGMYQDVVKFVGSCSTCLAYKTQNHTTLGEMGRPKQCSRPFQMISIDFVGPLPTTRKQNSYMLVITCCFSKFCHIFPLRRPTSDIVIKILEDSIFLVHGIPQTIFLDNGSQFTSSNTDSFFLKYKIPNIYYTPKYTPQINTVERYNKTIVKIGRAHV